MSPALRNCTSMRIATSGTVALLCCLSACTATPAIHETEGELQCEAASDHLAICAGMELRLTECDASIAEEILSTPCEAFVIDDPAAERADGFLGLWLDAGDECSFDFQCEDELICIDGTCAAPALTYGSRCTSDDQCGSSTVCRAAQSGATRQCLSPAKKYQFCSDDQHCESGLVCRPGSGTGETEECLDRGLRTSDGSNYVCGARCHESEDCADGLVCLGANDSRRRSGRCGRSTDQISPRCGL